MEYIEGEMLADRIGRGPLPVDEAIPLFIQIAEGLEAAHEKGIIHRDLKPANIKIGLDGKPKILDFGLAKAFAGEEAARTDSSQSPTLTKGTALGAIVGTPSYMSPEQAKGQDVDKRTDIFVFGCVLYECLTGKKAFEGETATETLGAIIHTEPDWVVLPANTPSNIRRLLELCFRKDARRRTRDIGDVALELELDSDSVEVPRGIRWQTVVLGSDEMGNLISLCRIHHGLIHRGICSMSGTVGVDLKFERPRLVNQPEHEPAESLVVDDVDEEVSHEVVSGPDDDNVDNNNQGDDDDESWRDEVIADIFDGPPSPKPPEPEGGFADWLSNWCDQQEALKLEARSRNRRARRYPELGASAHVFTEEVSTGPHAEHLETSVPKPSGGSSSG